VEIKDISKNLILISEGEFLFNSALAIGKFVEILKIKQDGPYKELNNVKRNPEKNRDIKRIKNCKKTLDKFGVIKEDGKENYNLKILFALKDKPDLIIIYLYKINEKDCLDLKENTKQSYQKYVLEIDIDALLKFIKNASKFGSLTDFPKKSSIEVINRLNKAEITKEDYILFENYINKYDEIINLQSSVIQSEFLIKKI
jgi:hypothetical protein